MKIDIVRCSDWVAVYIDGKLVDEGHSLNTSMLLSHFGEVHEHSVDEAWAEAGNPFPKNFSEFCRV